MKTSAIVLSFALAALAAPQPRGFGGFGKGATGANAKGQNNGAAGSAAAGNNNNNAGSAASAASASAAAAAASASSAAAATTTGTATTVANGTDNNPNPQDSLTLDPRVLATGFEQNGQAVQEAGQVASLTSGNNFINFCLTVPNLPITNGQQITTGSCNPAPIGAIPPVGNMPSSKFTFPANGGTVAANTEFTISMAIQNMETGNFVNAQTNYFAAPQQLNSQSQIIGHTHVVVETLSSLDQTTPTDPQKFAFFKGVNAAAVNGLVTADVTSGVPAGAYRLCSINAAANHQPVIVPIAQHGFLDDCVYFTASDNGASNSTAASGSSAAAAGTAAAAGNAAASASSAAAGNAAATASSAAAAGASAATSGKGNNNAAGGAAAGATGAKTAGKGGFGKGKGKRFTREH